MRFYDEILFFFFLILFSIRKNWMHSIKTRLELITWTQMSTCIVRWNFVMFANYILIHLMKTSHMNPPQLVFIWLNYIQLHWLPFHVKPIQWKMCFNHNNCKHFVCWIIVEIEKKWVNERVIEAKSTSSYVVKCERTVNKDACYAY